jgi:cytochrome b6-f complex iron-sulfur subunit
VSPRNDLVPIAFDPSRRAFCSRGCLSAAAALTALAGCGGGGNSPTSPGGSPAAGSPLASATASVNGRTVAVTLDGPLATVGGAAIARTAAGNFLVARTGAESVAALTAACTHEGNTVTNFTGSQFVCPVHGSQFNVSGAVAQGPATRPLATFPTTVAAGIATFTV